jgi:2-keto-3-deoxy-L-rhamnonate aldolase RhmA
MNAARQAIGMVRSWTLALVAVLTPFEMLPAQGERRLNPVIELLEQRKPVFGVYAPSNRRPRPGTPAAGALSDPQLMKTAADLAREALGYAAADYLFDGSMEDDFDRAFPVFAEFAKRLAEARPAAGAAGAPLHHPLIVKTHKVDPDRALAAERIRRQLNLGVSGIVFVGVESADEVRAGLAAMRFRSQGGTRPDDVGDAPALWGISREEYHARADLWPLNPAGELINWTIVESKEGLAHVREIAAVKGIGVLFPGAGTLRGVFTTTDGAGQRVFDERGWEAAIQQVLAACNEFNVPCGYPANANDIETRMRQGFSVFVMNWGEQGFRAIEVGRKMARRD